MNFPIDFVVDWVDDSDPKWVSSRDQYRKVSPEKNGRFRDWELLPFWFRAVEKNAPWVNKIYLVTDNQRPEWLNLDNPKLQLISHQDYIPDKYLPVFNSNSIELPINRIPHLSEHFVFFNDDLFINSPVTQNDFFSTKGLPKDSAVLSPQIPKDTSITSITTNNVKIVNNYFSRKDILHQWNKFLRYEYGRQNIKTLACLIWPIILGFQDFHLPISFLKSTFNSVWKLEELRLNTTLQHRFRSDNDYNIYLFRYFQLLKGDFSPRSVSFGKYYNLSDNNEEPINDINKGLHKAIVLNDQDDIADFEKAKSEIKETFMKKYPHKSSFEK